MRRAPPGSKIQYSYPSSMESGRKRRSNELRIQAMEDRLKRMKDSKSMISASLSGRAIPESKHVTFEIDSDEEVIDSTHNSNNRDIFGEDCADSDTEMYALPDKPQFEGKSGAELFKLQQQTRNDDRFRLDSRFAEDKSSDVESEKKGDSFVEEKHKNLQILGDVLGRDVRTQRRPLIRNLVRFDPTLDSHKKYIIQKEDSEIQDKPTPVPTNAPGHSLPSETTEMPKVTKQTYYEYQDASSIALLFESSQGNSNSNPEPGVFNFEIEEPEPVQSQPYSFEVTQADSTLSELVDTEQHFGMETESSKEFHGNSSNPETQNLFFFHTTNAKLRNRIDAVKFCRQQDIPTLTREWRDKAAALMRDCKRKHRDAVRWKRKSISIN